MTQAIETLLSDLRAAVGDDMFADVRDLDYAVSELIGQAIEAEINADT